jgi:thioredoxin-like negative regulator of GroEL
MVFFFSDDCRSCIEMKKTIGEVYPDYKGAVTLVEVNVYNPDNRELVERTGVHTTPVELFIQASGSETLVLDVMSAEALRDQLQLLVGGQP